MDHAGGLRRRHAARDGPGPRLLRAHGEVGDEAQQVVPGADHPVQPAVGQAQPFQELAAVGRVHLRDLGLDGRADHHRAGIVGGGEIQHRPAVRIAGGGRAFLDVADIEHGLGGHQPQFRGGDLLALRHGGARGAALAQRRDQRLHQRQLRRRLLVVAARLLLQRGHALLQAVEVGQHQLGLDDLAVAQRVHAALHMRDVAILEAAQHMDDGVHLADVGQELVAQPLALGGAADEARDVHEFQAGGDDLGTLADGGQRGEARVGHRHPADIGLDGAEGVVGRLRRHRLRQRVEERGLAHIGQADDAAVETHLR